MAEIEINSRDIVARHRWVADLIAETRPPRLGEWDMPEMLRDAASEIESLRSKLEEVTKQRDSYQVRLAQRTKLVAEIHADSLQRAPIVGQHKVVNMGASLWNRICDVVDPPEKRDE